MWAPVLPDGWRASTTAVFYEGWMRTLVINYTDGAEGKFSVCGGHHSSNLILVLSNACTVVARGKEKFNSPYHLIALNFAVTARKGTTFRRRARRRRARPWQTGDRRVAALASRSTRCVRRPRGRARAKAVISGRRDDGFPALEGSNGDEMDYSLALFDTLGGYILNGQVDKDVVLNAGTTRWSTSLSPCEPSWRIVRGTTCDSRGRTSASC